ncbi:MAG: hypothetical protein ACJ74Q_14885 [Pyrinomonadaceae bacterium]
MSTNAAAGRITSVGAITPPMAGTLTTNSRNPNLQALNGVKYTIDNPVLGSSNFTGLLSTGTNFSGTYDPSSGSINFSMRINGAPYVFNGSITMDGENMGGRIFDNQLMGRPSGHPKSGATGDDGSWSAQAPPHTDDDDGCGRRGHAAEKGLRA